MLLPTVGHTAVDVVIGGAVVVVGATVDGVVDEVLEAVADVVDVDEVVVGGLVLAFPLLHAANDRARVMTVRVRGMVLMGPACTAAAGEGRDVRPVPTGPSASGLSARPIPAREAAPEPPENWVPATDDAAPGAW